nr:MAG: baseplate J-like protein [Bacteriophage sp.]UWI11875.1 MAG: baseplate J-like protein [Bacteriophage sp.]
MGITNKWLNPYQRSYQQIKAKLVESLMGLKDPQGQKLITDYSEGNILIIILSLFAAIAEVLHYYVDNMARETFLSTARRYDSVVKHGALVDYHARAAIAATVDVILSRSITGNSIGAKLTIPQGTLFTDSSGNSWLSARDVIWYSNVTTCKVPIIQHERYTASALNNMVIPTGDRVILNLGTLPNGKYYEQGSMSLQIGGETWVLVDTFAKSKPTDKHFMVSVDEALNPYIMFGDGTFGKKPAAGAKITNVVFYLTNGTQGNVKSNTITSVPSVISSSITDATVSNAYDAGGGSNYENFTMLKEHIPLSVKTLGVAITKEDFESLAMLVDGVNKAKADYECGRKLTIYISPDGGAVASSELINRVYNLLSQRAPMTTWLKVKSAGKVQIILEMDVTGKKSYKTAEIQTQILTALYNAYSPEQAQIGGSVRVSDIYALIDNLSTVDYLHLTKFYIKPWPTTLYGNKELNLGQFKLNKAKGSMTYYITFNSSTTFTVRSVSNGYVTTGSVGSSIQIIDKANGFDFSLDIQNNSYQSGYRYSITVSEPNHDYEDPGFNLPVFENASQLTLTVNEIV